MIRANDVAIVSYMAAKVDLQPGTGLTKQKPATQITGEI
jgi:hypothetical protein